MLIHLLQIPLLKLVVISDLLLDTQNFSIRGQKNACEELLDTLKAIIKPIKGEANLPTDLNGLFLS